MIDLDASLTIVTEARAEARRRNVPPMTFVVTDPGGVVKAAIREDGHNIFGPDIAKSKAMTCLGFGKATLEMALAPNNEAGRTAALSGVTGGNFIPIGGGILVLDGEGRCIGAAAASGAPHETDHAIITHAVIAAGLHTPPTPGIPATR